MHKYPSIYYFTFNGKEKDYESSYHYYGARYYHSELLASWLSVDPLSDKYPSVSPYAYCIGNPVKLVDPDGRDGDVEVNKDDRTINVNMNIYYNKNRNNMKNIIGRGSSDDPNQLDIANKKGFASKIWQYTDEYNSNWSISFNINFVGLENDNEVKKAMDDDPVGNILCYDDELKSAGKWNPNNRTITLGLGSFYRMAYEEDAGTLSHEIGHGLGLSHPSELHKGEPCDFGIMSYSLYRTVWNSEVSKIASRILRVASTTKDRIVHLQLYGSNIREPKIVH